MFPGPRSPRNDEELIPGVPSPQQARGSQAGTEAAWEEDGDRKAGSSSGSTTYNRVCTWVITLTSPIVKGWD